MSEGNSLAHRQEATANKKTHRKHTHSHVVRLVKLQSGEKIWAAAKPEKKRNVTSGAARGDIVVQTTLQVVGLEGKKSTAFKWLAKIE
jgi:hypothetical protein